MNNGDFKEIEACRVCGSKNLKDIISLGELYVSDFFDSSNKEQGTKAPLHLVLCDKEKGGCGLLQLRHTVSGDALYRNYWYRSGVNKTMTDELNDIAQKAEALASLSEGDHIIDIGSNDGTLLRGYGTPGVKLIGFDPARNLEEHGRKGPTEIIVDFFKHGAWREKFGEAKAKIITAIAMFYDLDDPNSFVADVVKCLDDEGVFIIQMMYLPSFLERTAFDGICHEHLEYYSMLSLENLLEKHGLEIFDLEMREHVNEGSIRFYIRKFGKGNSLEIREEAKKTVEEMRAKELELGLHNKETYEKFVARVMDIKNKVVSFIKEELAKGKKVHAYAASTKGNTTLQFFELHPGLVEAVADRNPQKWGKFTAGTLIPVISEEESRAQEPDYYLILAWHFLPEFIKREEEYFKKGGKFIVPMPEFKIISGE
jgi:SAM-dependent methyltransferase